MRKNNSRNLCQTWRMSYIQFATIASRDQIGGCLWRKLRQPFAVSVPKSPRTHHERTTSHHVHVHSSDDAKTKFNYLRRTNPHKADILGATHLDAMV
ncbi:hypothetical protein HDF08_000391 [Edaphobacter lichenicola]|uniref:Uncharacterized protein n=1 Tax=Tunturiibacter lichenicola TaxID=2051959 RepID=A0A852VCY1_9BACT|nr:hypothetical protein [Edaphobacter lichenicola]